jgi:hypothetical protein
MPPPGPRLPRDTPEKAMFTDSLSDLYIQAHPPDTPTLWGYASHRLQR